VNAHAVDGIQGGQKTVDGQRPHGVMPGFQHDRLALVVHGLHEDVLVAERLEGEVPVGPIQDNVQSAAVERGDNGRIQPVGSPLETLDQRSGALIVVLLMGQQAVNRQDTQVWKRGLGEGFASGS